MKKLNKIQSILIIAVIYIIAIGAGYALSFFIKDDLVTQLFVADIIAGLIVYVTTLIFKNVSVYDPYWSLTPWVLITLGIIQVQAYTVPVLVLYAAFSFWSWRLTINWAITFKNIYSEDWRYSKYRDGNKVLFHIINFFGFQYMPTLLVFAGLIPFIMLVQYGSNYWALLGAAFIVFGTLLELFADHQVHHFLKTTKERKTCREGLWAYSRHPNYLGEISIWFGLALAHIIQYPTLWYNDIGVLFVFILFYFISIPMMEKRQLSRREDYKIYVKTTSKLLILPNRKINEEEPELEKE